MKDMRNKMSKDYHDYVFRDGKLLGDFDNMYKYSKASPWHQDTVADEWFTEIGFVMLRDKAPYTSILEIGCGLGYISRKLTLLTSGFVDAVDVSSEAINKAKSIHNGERINFSVADIKEKNFEPLQVYDLVVIKDVFWYVFDYMETVIVNINKCVGENGYIYINQSFPCLEKNFVGKQVINCPECLLNYFSTNYKSVYTVELNRWQVLDDGPQIHYLGEKI